MITFSCLWRQKLKQRFVGKWQTANSGALLLKKRLNERRNWIVFFFKEKITLKLLKISGHPSRESAFKPLRFVKTLENISKDTSQRRTHGYSINLIIEVTVKIKVSLWCSKRKSILSSFLVVLRLGLWLKMRFIAMSMVSWSGMLVKGLVTS